jgi:hypothetical protein
MKSWFKRSAPKHLGNHNKNHTDPFVVREIVLPAASHSGRREGRCRRSVIGGGEGELARAWAKRRPRFPTPRTWIRG